MSDYTRTTLAKLAAVTLDAGLAEGFDPDESLDFWQQSAFGIADAVLTSDWLAGVKAEAVRDAARAANQGYVDEQAGIGPARVRTDWLFEYADQIATSASSAPDRSPE